jgi:hypothetical protein
MIIVEHLVETSGDLQKRMGLRRMSFRPFPQDLCVEQEPLTIEI